MIKIQWLKTNRQFMFALTVAASIIVGKVDVGSAKLDSRLMSPSCFQRFLEILPDAAIEPIFPRPFPVAEKVES